MAEEQQKKHISTEEETVVQLISRELITVMNMRTNMVHLEKSVDAYLKNIPREKRTHEERVFLLGQIKTGIGAMESLYNRISQTYPLE